jgi:exosortase
MRNLREEAADEVAPARGKMTESSAEMTEASAAQVKGAGDVLTRRREVYGTLAVIAAAVALYAPILYFMVVQWYDQEDYSHGFLIAPLAVFFAWERRNQLRKAALSPSWWGILPLALGSVTLLIGRLGAELMNMRASFVLTLIGLVLLLLGRQIFRILLFPLLFLFLMVPLPESLVNVIAFPLQLVAADLAVKALFLLDVPVLREGNIIHLANAKLFVAEACSGLRSLMALVTLGVVFAYFFRRSMAERIVIVLSAIPIAIIVNSFRVALTGILTIRFGESVAGGVIHETQGLFTFGLAFLLLLAEARVLARLHPLWGRLAKGRGRAEA